MDHPCGYTSKRKGQRFMFVFVCCKNVVNKGKGMIFRQIVELVHDCRPCGVFTERKQQGSMYRVEFIGKGMVNSF